ncbi:hypothetical protein GALMADRAFT_241105 [Galerina marginata CBS 339.88]|uniref:ZW10 C-terminal helical domain-containing protein n=1 Tax=Galerina marginata (strain CBS 339.88) TaxID=685588 RepID=A0A067TEB3_GALM3|nr:hypothetical protein GALMADRAFT_241105 [Galerina marginata CBS 339.88]
MAFPIPEHLPKRPVPVDVSSKILYKIDSATKETLNSSLASSWVQELEDSIQAAKRRIHDRIQSDLPKFQHQLEASKSVQTRYEALNSRLNGLEDALSNPETGIIPTLVSTLEKHSALAQEASDAEAIFEASSYLLTCRNRYSALVSLVQQGKLPEAVNASEEVQQLVDGVPMYIKQTEVVIDLRQRFNAMKARVQDQLSDAYSRSIIISPAEIVIYPIVQVRQSETMLELPSVLHSLSPTSLTNHLTTLRRDIITHFVDHVLKQPYFLSLETSLAKECRLSLIPAPPNTEDLSARLDNVSSVLAFLSSHLFLHLPPQDGVQFTRTLSKPITNSVLNNLLVPTLPSSFGLLPSYLGLLKRAVSFEEKDISGLLETDKNDGSIKAWSDGVSLHYEKRRRVEILELARQEIVFPEDPKDTFEAVSEGGPETSIPSVIPVQVDEDFKDEAWGFDEPVTANPVDDSTDGWGFDDDIDADSIPEPEPEPEPEPDSPTTPMDIERRSKGVELDPADAWGWNEDEDVPVEDLPEDNPWDDPWSDSGEPKPIVEPPKPVASSIPPKAATRLEKLASKNKKHVNGNGNGNSYSPLSSLPVNPTSPITPPPKKPEPEPQSAQKASRTNGAKRPADVVTTIAPKEFYKVPKRTKRVLKMVETVIDESKLFYASNLFPSSRDGSTAPGTILAHSASSIVDLYQALYPVKFSEELNSPERGMLFSNSCLYMTGAIQRIEDTIYGQPILKERLSECRQLVKILGDSWFDETMERQQLKIEAILVEGAQGFAYTGDQDRYDECEAAVSDALKRIKRLAQGLKGILTKSKYYTVVGSVADIALSRVLRDVLALPDIPELESHRLSELCRIFNALEGLFNEDPEQPSFVVAYVPSWLKFSYLSELLEASLADITYLFEQGALVDFHVDELVNLVRALFADTSLRTNTINKLMNGHPQTSQ